MRATDHKHSTGGLDITEQQPESEESLDLEGEESGTDEGENTPQDNGEDITDDAGEPIDER